MIKRKFFSTFKREITYVYICRWVSVIDSFSYSIPSLHAVNVITPDEMVDDCLYMTNGICIVMKRKKSVYKMWFSLLDGVSMKDFKDLLVQGIDPIDAYKFLLM